MRVRGHWRNGGRTGRIWVRDHDRDARCDLDAPAAVGKVRDAADAAAKCDTEPDDADPLADTAIIPVVTAADHDIAPPAAPGPVFSDDAAEIVATVGRMFSNKARDIWLGTGWDRDPRPPADTPVAVPVAVLSDWDGWDPDDAARLAMSGWTAREAARWRNDGFSAADMTGDYADCDLEGARRARSLAAAHGLTPADAARQVMNGDSDDDILAWLTE